MENTASIKKRIAKSEDISHFESELSFFITVGDGDFDVHILQGDPEALGLPSSSHISKKTLSRHIEFDNTFSRISGKAYYRQLLENNVYRLRDTNVFLLALKGDPAPYWLLIKQRPLNVLHGGPVLYGEVLHVHDGEPYTLTLFRMAHYDDPTGLLNREALRHHLSLLEKGERIYALFMDLDNFKCINDTYGHLEGDNVLKAVAERMKGDVDENCRIYRIGGDEFFVLLRGRTHEEALAYANELLQRFQSIPAKDDYVDLGVSIGLISVKSEEAQFEHMLKMTDQAMYRAKARGKHTVYDFSEAP